MAQENVDFIYYAGNNIPIRFEGVVREDTDSPLTAGDIIGASWGVTRYEEDTTPIISKSLSASTISVPSDGVLLVTMLSTDTEDLYGEFSHELTLLASGNVLVCASRGRMTIKYKIANTPI